MTRHPADRPHYSAHHSAEERAGELEARRIREADALLAAMGFGLHIKEAAPRVGLTYERAKLLLRWDREGRPPIHAGGRPTERN